jgi:ArsR family transcriptional regulator
VVVARTRCTRSPVAFDRRDVLTRIDNLRYIHDRESEFQAACLRLRGAVVVSATLESVSCCAPLATPVLSEEEAEATADLFKALADPARVRIVNSLATIGKAVCACEFEPALGLSQPTVSHHLKKLTDAGLLEREQRGKWAYFSLKREAVETLAAVADLKGVVADGDDR